MAINLGGSVKQAANTFGTYVKKFVLPLAVGIGVLGVLCAILPASISRFIQP